MSSQQVWNTNPLPAEVSRVLRFQGADLEVFGAHQELRVPVVVHILARVKQWINHDQNLCWEYVPVFWWQ